jgi:hypothetical protein
MRLDSKFLTVIWLGAALGLGACSKTKSGGAAPGPGGPGPGSPSIPNPYAGPYAPGSGNDPMLSIANTMQGAYGNIVILNPVNYGLVNISPTGVGGISWLSFYQTYVVRSVQSYGGYNSQYGGAGYWGGFNYGGFYQNNQNTFANWQYSQNAVVYVTGGSATGGQPMNTNVFVIFNTFISNAYSMYAQYTPYYQQSQGYYYPRQYCGVWPSNYQLGSVYYGGGTGIWGISLGLNLSWQ